MVNIFGFSLFIDTFHFKAHKNCCYTCKYRLIHSRSLRISHFIHSVAWTCFWFENLFLVRTVQRKSFTPSLIWRFCDIYNYFWVTLSVLTENAVILCTKDQVSSEKGERLTGEVLSQRCGCCHLIYGDLDKRTCHYVIYHLEAPIKWAQHEIGEEIKQYFIYIKWRRQRKTD